MQDFVDKFLLFWKELPQNIGPFWESMVNFVIWLTGLQYQNAQLLLIVVFVLFLAVLILWKVHSGLIKLQRKKVQECIYEYDRIWYLEAKAMYAFNQKMRQQWQVNQLAHGTRSILALNKKDYLVNRKKIVDDIKKLEKYMGQQIVSVEQLKKIGRLHLRIAGSSMIQHVIGRGLIVMTLGLYGLKWERVYYK